jgi:hypothetical protein
MFGARKSVREITAAPAALRMTGGGACDSI